MKRKLIDFDVFERIQKDSLSTAQRELEEASYYLARALNLEAVALNCYGSEEAIFETVDGNYVHANYKIDNGYIEFDNVQELIINEESEKTRSREVLAQMLDCLIESNDQKAEELFAEWMNPGAKRIFNEVKKRRVVCRAKKNGQPSCKAVMWNQGNVKYHQPAKTKIARSKGKKIANLKRGASKRKTWAAARGRANAAIGKRMVKEWAVLSENVMGYVDFYENGPTLSQSEVKRDDSGNVVTVRIPTSKLRNEAKMLQFNWKTLNTDVVVKRGQSKKVCENMNFAKAISEIKRQNALSDDKALEEALEKTASAWPEILYLTQSELAEQVNKALESVSATNYDDQTCEFIAEGLLRTAHAIFTDRVAKILNLSGAKIAENANDKYAEFKNVVETYYNKLDESKTIEMQVFVDLYEALRSIHELAKSEEDTELAVEASAYLDELLEVITRKSEPSLELASEAAEWLYDLVETNLETSEWETKEPVVSATGEHPDLMKKARMSYAPSSDFSGDYGDVSPASDGKDIKGDVADELATRGWSNEGGENTYPSLNNPYLLNNGEYAIKGEKTVDSDSDQLAHAGGSDTWPSLQNPYCKPGDSVKEVK